MHKWKVAGLWAGMVMAALAGCSTSVRGDQPPAPGGLDRAAPRSDPATTQPAGPTRRPDAEAADRPQAEPAVRETAAPTERAPAAEREPVSRSALPPDQVPEVTGTTSRFAPGTPDATLRAAFDCAMRDDFACYAALNVVSNRDGEIPLAHLRNYQWRAFRARWQSYMVAREPFTVHITRRVRDPGKTPRIKLFLFSDERDNPAPCIFELQDGVWRIYANSL